MVLVLAPLGLVRSGRWAGARCGRQGEPIRVYGSERPTGRRAGQARKPSAEREAAPERTQSKPIRVYGSERPTGRRAGQARKPSPEGEAAIERTQDQGSPSVSP